MTKLFVLWNAMSSDSFHTVSSSSCVGLIPMNCFQWSKTCISEHTWKQARSSWSAFELTTDKILSVNSSKIKPWFFLFFWQRNRHLFISKVWLAPPWSCILSVSLSVSQSCPGEPLRKSCVLFLPLTGTARSYGTLSGKAHLHYRVL